MMYTSWRNDEDLLCHNGVVYDSFAEAYDAKKDVIFSVQKEFDEYDQELIEALPKEAELSNNPDYGDELEIEAPVGEELNAADGEILQAGIENIIGHEPHYDPTFQACLLYTSPSPRD